MSTFITGLVVGKFSPLHYGHQMLIRTAQAQCERIIVISYPQDRFDNCTAENHKKWILPTLRSQDLLHVVNGPQPADDEPDEVHRAFCAHILSTKLYSFVDAVFTSETYGDGFAEYLSKHQGTKVSHVLVDINRKRHPTSGTNCRSNLDVLREFTNPAVAASFVKRLAILGGESSGKSTLATKLTKMLQTIKVDEYGRTFCETIRPVDKLQPQDLLMIAERHVNDEWHAAYQHVHNGINPYVPIICDTTPLTTQFYYEKLFPNMPMDPKLRQLAERKYDYVVVCDPNIPFVQDGQRQNEAFRNEGFEYAKVFGRSISKMNDVLVVSGTVEERCLQVLEHLLLLNTGLGKIQRCSES